MRSGTTRASSGNPAAWPSYHMPGMPFPLGTQDVPFEVVAHHPCLLGFDAQSPQGSSVCAVVRFAEALVPFDLDEVEPVTEVEAVDLGTLLRTRAIREEAEAHTSLPEMVDDGVGSREKARAIVSDAGEMSSEFELDLRARRGSSTARQLGEGPHDDLDPRLLDAEAPSGDGRRGRFQNALHCCAR